MPTLKAGRGMPQVRKRPRRMKTYVEPVEVTLIERSASNMRDRLLVRLLFHLGCRVSEALGLSVEDIDFDSGTITIKHLKARLMLSLHRVRT